MWGEAGGGGGGGHACVRCVCMGGELREGWALNMLHCEKCGNTAMLPAISMPGADVFYFWV